MRPHGLRRGLPQGSEGRCDARRALSSRPFCPCDSRRGSLWYLSAGLRYTTILAAHGCIRRSGNEWWLSLFHKLMVYQLFLESPILSDGHDGVPEFLPRHYCNLLFFYPLTPCDRFLHVPRTYPSKVVLNCASPDKDERQNFCPKLSNASAICKRGCTKIRVITAIASARVVTARCSGYDNHRKTALGAVGCGSTTQRINIFIR